MKLTPQAASSRPKASSSAPRVSSKSSPPTRSKAPPKPPPRSADPLQELLEEDDSIPVVRDEPARCGNCGAVLATQAVLCVECGFDLRQGQVLARGASLPKKKKGKTAIPQPLLMGAAIGVPALVVVALVLFFVMRGGDADSSGGQAVAASTAGAVGGATGSGGGASRAALPESSKDPKDWRTSFPAFAANFSLQQPRDAHGRARWELHSGEIAMAEDAPTVQWQGVLLGKDRRSIVFATDEQHREAFGLGFPGVATLPEPYAVLFSVDPARSADLLKLSYRPVRIEGKLSQSSQVVWLDDKGRPVTTKPGPPLNPAEPPILDLPPENVVRPIYVMWVEITKFELAK